MKLLHFFTRTSAAKPAPPSASVDKSVPAVEAVSADKLMLVAEPAYISESTAISESAYISESTPISESASVSESVPVIESVSVSEATPVVESASVPPVPPSLPAQLIPPHPDEVCALKALQLKKMHKYEEACLMIKQINSAEKLSRETKRDIFDFLYGLFIHTIVEKQYPVERLRPSDNPLYKEVIIRIPHDVKVAFSALQYADPENSIVDSCIYHVFPRLEKLRDDVSKEYPESIRKIVLASYLQKLTVDEIQDGIEAMQKIISKNSEPPPAQPPAIPALPATPALSGTPALPALPTKESIFVSLTQSQEKESEKYPVPLLPPLLRQQSLPNMGDVLITPTSSPRRVLSNSSKHTRSKHKVAFNSLREPKPRQVRSHSVPADDRPMLLTTWPTLCSKPVLHDKKTPTSGHHRSHSERSVGEHGERRKIERKTSLRSRRQRHHH